MQDTVRALIREREGYEQKGKADRVEAVDQELRRLGHAVPEPGNQRAAERRPKSGAETR